MQLESNLYFSYNQHVNYEVNFNPKRIEQKKPVVPETTGFLILSGSNLPNFELLEDRFGGYWKEAERNDHMESFDVITQNYLHPPTF